MKRPHYLQFEIAHDSSGAHEDPIWLFFVGGRSSWKPMKGRGLAVPGSFQVLWKRIDPVADEGDAGFVNFVGAK